MIVPSIPERMVGSNRAQPWKGLVGVTRGFNPGRANARDFSMHASPSA
jgi:hypothetical protein